MSSVGFSPFEAILQQITESFPDADRAKIREIFNGYAQHVINRAEAARQLEGLIDTSEPLKALDAFVPPQNPVGSRGSAPRRAPERWTPEEDDRLCTAIEANGLNNWQLIAALVGGGRTKAQCTQRWTRVLDPKIDKSNWSFEEEQQLINLVAMHGSRSWSKISQDMGHRSDVQCRFRWNFLNKKAVETGSDVRPISAPSVISQRSREYALPPPK
jgi:hypothetical protein